MEPKLTVRVESFSYRQGIPKAETEHGGGFVFDARCLPNPGREEQYKALNGRDEGVKRYIQGCQEATIFLHHVTSLVELAVHRYIDRGFTELLIQFGCTGGQHRSVYCAEYLRDYLLRISPVQVFIHHRGLGICEP